MMPYEKLSTHIAISDLQKLAIYKHSGTLDILRKGRFHLNDWEEKYIVICKGHSITWNMCCYPKRFASTADMTFSMLEIESALDYDDENVIGITIKFVDPTKSPMVFRCDTKVKRKIWREHFNTAILEAHNDSGYASGGSVSQGTTRQSTGYDTIADVDKECISEAVNIMGKENELEVTKDREGQRSSDETYVKKVFSPPVQETENAAKHGQKKLPENTEIQMSSKKKNSHTHAQTEKTFERVADAEYLCMTQMENLKSRLPKPGDRSDDHCHLDTNEIDQAAAQTQHSKNVDGTALTLPTGPPLSSDITGTVSSSSFCFVKGYSDTSLEHSSADDQHLQTAGADSDSSIKGDVLSQTFVKEKTSHSAVKGSMNTVGRQNESLTDPTSINTAPFFICR
ncbi:uncharacterized protein LOC123546951 isoform X2 [Mercenaria mercenaria]|uniref:uncharacterized protein LOC123546951 isoform X2 n=1 Tax=Mercenaria mercenaria TaxID=6596 RepID=UPI00234F758C|nr:uncharacterized protein LOC123546951 isoform X2 [Mercenaria mercenaria]